jgi:lysophospholipase L1-like esterase
MRGSRSAKAFLAALAGVALGCSSSATSRPDAGGDAPAGDTAPGDGEAGGLADDPVFGSFWSGTALAVPSNQLVTTAAPFMNTYRTYVKPRAGGSYNWRFWMSNTTDSTYGAGPLDPNQPGGTWRIAAATLADGGTTPDGSVVAGTVVPMTFGGAPSRDVGPDEKFWSDPAAIDLPDGHLLAFTWAVSAAAAGPVLTCASSSILSSWIAYAGDATAQEAATGFSTTNDRLVAPALFANDRPVTNRLCFLGDSITQGIGSTRNAYSFWVAKIADGLPPEVGIWNLGSGYARAGDAASDGAWLAKAKQCGEVAIALGVNDIANEMPTPDVLLGYLTTIIGKLRAHNPAVKIILFTVPTFNFTGAAYTTWKQVNDTILSAPPAGVDRVFDVAAVLSQPAPNDGLVKPEYNTGSDAHPNDAGSAAIAAAFLAWY